MFESIAAKLRAWVEARNARDRVTFDDEGVTRTMRDGAIEYVAWDDLIGVDIATTDEGPWSDDVFFLLWAEDHGCLVPSEAEGAQELLARLQELPAFDDEAMIHAMGCTHDELFRVWSRESPDPAGSTSRQRS